MLTLGVIIGVLGAEGTWEPVPTYSAVRLMDVPPPGFCAVIVTTTKHKNKVKTNFFVMVLDF